MWLRWSELVNSYGTDENIWPTITEVEVKVFSISFLVLISFLLFEVIRCF